MPVITIIGVAPPLKRGAFVLRNSWEKISSRKRVGMECTILRDTIT
jgi:hypothetical protein